MAKALVRGGSGPVLPGEVGVRAGRDISRGGEGAQAPVTGARAAMSGHLSYRVQRLQPRAGSLGARAAPATYRRVASCRKAVRAKRSRLPGAVDISSASGATLHARTHWRSTTSASRIAAA